jgi:hypothetical protein
MTGTRPCGKHLAQCCSQPAGPMRPKPFTGKTSSGTPSPWSLAGLAQTLKAQGKSDEAAFAEQRLQKAWRNREKPEAVAALFQ